VGRRPRLDTKKKIVAKFGDNAAFEKGKPSPPPKAALQRGARTASAASSAARVVRAKLPLVRKASAK
jgi:hypothetical protein